MWYAIVWGVVAPVVTGGLLGAVATYVVLSLTGLQPSDLTKGIVGVLGAAAYYTFQGTFTWRSWFISYQNKMGSVSQRGAQNANNGGLNVKAAKNSTVNISPFHAPAPPTVVVVHSAPAHAEIPVSKPSPLPEAPLPPMVKLTEKPSPTKTEPTPLLDETLHIPATEFEARPLTLNRWDRVEGFIESDQPLSVFILREEDYLLWRNNEVDPAHGELWLENGVAGSVSWKAPATGRYRVVFDAHGKQNDRKVSVSIRRLPATPRKSRQAA